jgi:hypothetical protein
MSIRPVDLQVLLPKSSEMTKVQGADNRNEHLMQQQFAEQLQKEVTTQHQQVLNAQKSDNPNVDKDGRNNSKDDNRRRRRQKRQPPPPDSDNPLGTSHGVLDISV